MLEGNFTSIDFKKAHLHLESTKALFLRDYVALPTELNATELNVTMDAPIYFDSNASYMAVTKIRSNMLNIDANVSYANTLHVSSKINIPKTSLLRHYSKELKWDNISPLSADVSIGKKI